MGDEPPLLVDLGHAGRSAPVTQAEAVDFIRPAVHPKAAFWTDLGAGSGAFTEALAHLLPAAGRVVAVERDSAAVDRLRKLAARLPPGTAAVTVARGDVENLDGIPEISGKTWDGALFGNVLHFLPAAARTLSAAAERLSPSGRIVVIEYDRVAPSRWVPHPVPVEKLRELAGEAGLSAPDVVNARPSRYRGVLYCAVLALEGRAVAASRAALEPWRDEWSESAASAESSSRPEDPRRWPPGTGGSREPRST